MKPYTVYAATPWHVWLYRGNERVTMPQRAPTLAPGDRVDVALIRK